MLWFGERSQALSGNTVAKREQIGKGLAGAHLCPDAIFTTTARALHIMKFPALGLKWKH